MRPFLLAAVSGVLGALCFPTYSLWPLVFVALVPLLLAVAGSSPRRAFVLGWLTGAVGFLAAFSWVLPTIARFEGITSRLASPFFLLFVGYYALQLALFALGSAWSNAHQRPATSGMRQLPIVFTAAWWVLLEWGVPKMIPWSFGDTLAGSAVLRQGADVAGVYGLSFLVVFVNAAVAAAIVRHRMPLHVRLRPLLPGAALLLLALAYGWLALHRSAVSTQDPSTGLSTSPALSVTIVQGGLHSGRDDLVAANEEAWQVYSSLSTQDSASFDVAQDRSGTDLIVWPETVLRVYLRQDAAYRARVVDLVHRLRRPLFVGSLDLPADRPGELNSGYLIQDNLATDTQDSALRDQHSVGMQVYHKRVLLPFGEYVPGARWLPLLTRWRTTGRFVAADASHPLTLASSTSLSPVTSTGSENGYDSRTRRTISFGPSICFEAIWPGAYNQLVRAGAEFLINITDDGWFGNTAGPYEHLNAARLRAVETRRWLVRASNSGVSAFIDPTGNIVDSLPLGAVGIVRHEIATTRSITFYVRHGDWPVLLSLLIIFGRWLAGSNRAKHG